LSFFRATARDGARTHGVFRSSRSNFFAKRHFDALFGRPKANVHTAIISLICAANVVVEIDKQKRKPSEAWAWRA